MSYMAGVVAFLATSLSLQALLGLEQVTGRADALSAVLIHFVVHCLLVSFLLKLAVGADVLPFIIDLAADPSGAPLNLDSFSKALAAGESGSTAVTDWCELPVVTLNAHGGLASLSEN